MWDNLSDSVSSCFYVYHVICYYNMHAEGILPASICDQLLYEPRKNTCHTKYSKTSSLKKRIDNNAEAS